ncbi:MAG TPA: hypothetical protein P5330_00800, partial [Candidatus Competibacteraceae bacterium]|nr:hypothetical protein [Candidatus Competibacteraceae bacterium]
MVRFPKFSIIQAGSVTCLNILSRLNQNQELRGILMIVYNLFPLLAGPCSQWEPHLQRAADQFAAHDMTAEHATARAWLGAAYQAGGDHCQAQQHTAQAAAQLESVNNISIEYPPQDVWWLHYQAAGENNPTAFSLLERAFQIMTDGIANLSDEG